MNNNKFFALIIESLMTQTEISSIEFIGDNLPTAELRVTVKTGLGSVVVTFNYHAEVVAIENIGKVKSHYLLKLASIVQSVESLIKNG